MDASHISSSTSMGIVVAAIVIGILLGVAAYRSSKNRKKKTRHS